jgi:hypothetical protein
MKNEKEKIAGNFIVNRPPRIALGVSCGMRREGH